jgi:hypothetical protein
MHPDPSWHKAYRDCKITSRVNVGPSDIKITLELSTGETREVYADVLEIEDLPAYGAIFDVGVYRTWSEMLDQEIDAVSWVTYRPADRPIVLS